MRLTDENMASLAQSLVMPNTCKGDVWLGGREMDEVTCDQLSY